MNTYGHMSAYDSRAVTLDAGLTALALRGLHERDGHYPFLDWFRRRRLDNFLYLGLMRLLWAASYVESNLLLKEVPLGAVALHVTASKGAPG